MNPLETICQKSDARVANRALEKQKRGLRQRSQRNPDGKNINKLPCEKRTLPILKYLSPNDAKRFWMNVKKGKPDECWEWAGGRIPDGYGHFHFSGIRARAHKVSYAIASGIDPIGCLVCHTCDNEPCVNPNHLFLGDNKSNQKDASMKGRSARALGEMSYSSKLTDDQVLEIRRLAQGQTQRSLAKLFGVGFKAISKIVLRQRWKHI